MAETQRVRDIRALAFRTSPLERTLPQETVGTTAKLVLGFDDTRGEVVFQDIGPGTIAMRDGTPPVSTSDGYVIQPSGTLKAVDTKAKSSWYAIASAANTKLSISVRR